MAGLAEAAVLLAPGVSAAALAAGTSAAVAVYALSAATGQHPSELVESAATQAVAAATRVASAAGASSLELRAVATAARRQTMVEGVIATVLYSELDNLKGLLDNIQKEFPDGLTKDALAKKLNEATGGKNVGELIGGWKDTLGNKENFEALKERARAMKDSIADKETREETVKELGSIWGKIKAGFKKGFDEAERKKAEQKDKDWEDGKKSWWFVVAAQPDQSAMPLLAQPPAPPTLTMPALSPQSEDDMNLGCALGIAAGMVAGMVVLAVCIVKMCSRKGQLRLRKACAIDTSERPSGGSKTMSS